MNSFAFNHFSWAALALTIESHVLLTVCMLAIFVQSFLCISSLVMWGGAMHSGAIV